MHTIKYDPIYPSFSPSKPSLLLPNKSLSQIHVFTFWQPTKYSYAYVCSSVGAIHCSVGSLLEAKVKARKQIKDLWGGDMLGSR